MPAHVPADFYSYADSVDDLRDQLGRYLQLYRNVPDYYDALKSDEYQCAISALGEFLRTRIQDGDYEILLCKGLERRKILPGEIVGNAWECIKREHGLVNVANLIGTLYFKEVKTLQVNFCDSKRQVILETFYKTSAGRALEEYLFHYAQEDFSPKDNLTQEQVTEQLLEQFPNLSRKFLQELLSNIRR